MPLTLAQHFALIEDEFAAARAAPLSARKTWLVATLLDNFADRAFEAARLAAPESVDGAEDVLAFRAALAARFDSVAQLFALCARAPGGPNLETRAVEVPIPDYPRLSVEDFMVSLYNGHTVQRVLLVFPDGSTRLAHDMLGDCLDWWRGSGLAG